MKETEASAHNQDTAGLVNNIMRAAQGFAAGSQELVWGLTTVYS